MDADTTHGITALVTGLIAGSGSWMASLRTTKDRIKTIAADLAKLRSDAVLQSEIELWKKALSIEIRREWRDLRARIERQIEQHDRLSHPSGAVNVEALDQRIETLEADLQRLEQLVLEKRYVTQSEFNEHIREQTRQWNEANRSLGEIRGEIKTRR